MDDFLNSFGSSAMINDIGGPMALIGNIGICVAIVAGVIAALAILLGKFEALGGAVSVWLAGVLASGAILFHSNWLPILLVTAPSIVMWTVAAIIWSCTHRRPQPSFVITYGAEHLATFSRID